MESRRFFALAISAPCRRSWYWNSGQPSLVRRCIGGGFLALGCARCGSSHVRSLVGVWLVTWDCDLSLTLTAGVWVCVLVGTATGCFVCSVAGFFDRVYCTLEVRLRFLLFVEPSDSVSSYRLLSFSVVVVAVDISDPDQVSSLLFSSRTRIVSSLSF